MGLTVRSPQRGEFPGPASSETLGPQQGLSFFPYPLTAILDLSVCRLMLLTALRWLLQSSHIDAHVQEKGWSYLISLIAQTTSHVKLA